MGRWQPSNLLLHGAACLRLTLLAVGGLLPLAAGLFFFVSLGLFAYVVRGMYQFFDAPIREAVSQHSQANLVVLRSLTVVSCAPA